MPLSIWIVLILFAAVPFGLVLGFQIAGMVLAGDEQMEKFGTREVIFVKEE
jgi:hypothetical protein